MKGRGLGPRISAPYSPEPCSIFRPRLSPRLDREIEGGSFAWLGLDPDTATVTGHDFAAYREADARSWIFPFSGMQSLEDLKNLVEIARLDADAVVGDVKKPCLDRCNRRTLPGLVGHRGRARRAVLKPAVLRNGWPGERRDGISAH